MKSRLLYSLATLLLLTVILIATLPAKHVIYRINFPHNMGLYDVSGTIWQGQAVRAVIQGQVLNQFNWDISAWHLLTATISADVSSSNRAATHINGTFNYHLLSQTLDLNNMRIALPAEVLFAHAALPVPIIGAGSIVIDVPTGSFDIAQPMPVCESLTGKGFWRQAGVLVSTGMVDLGEFTAGINCQNQQYNLTINEPNALGLSALAQGSTPQNLSISGQFKLPTSLPQDMQRVGQFLGQPGADGYTSFTW